MDSRFHGNDETSEFYYKTTNDVTSAPLTLNPLLPRLKFILFWEDVGKRLFERSEFPLAVSKEDKFQEASGRG